MDYQQTVETIKTKVDIVKFIEQYTRLRKTGNVYQGVCVLHPDSNTPSLTVYPDSQSYYCFGCKSGGSILEFVKAHYNYDFQEAIRFLAESAGLDIEAEESPQAKKRRQRIKTNARQVLRTQQQLQEKKNAFSYLNKRGFSKETIADFSLGFDSADNSIVIPINDGFGKPIGFSRRFLTPGDGPKYKNSRNDDVFNKGQLLYNLDKARKHIRDNLLVLEGYFDVISAWQAGFKNAVGILKDVLTEDQARLIARVTKDKTVILVPDNDATGRKSVRKNRDLLLAVNPDLHIQVAVPSGEAKDLNDVLVQSGEEGVQAAIAAAQPVDMYIVLELLESEPIRERQYQILRDYIKSVKNILVIEDIVKVLTRQWDKPEGMVRQFLELGTGGKTDFWYPHDQGLEKKMLASILSTPRALDMVADKLSGDCFYVFEHRVIFEAMLRIYQNKGSLNHAELYMELRTGKVLENVDELLSTMSAGYTSEADITALQESLLNLYYHRRLLMAALDIAETISTSNCDELEKIQAKAQDVVFSATDSTSIVPVHRINDLLSNRWEEYLLRMQGLIPRGLMTGYFSVDNVIKGFKNKHLIVLAAATSTGKTAFALNIVRNVLKRDPAVPVGVISLEMSAQEIMDRLIISELRIDGQRYDQGTLSDQEYDVFSKRINALYNKPLLISDQRGLNVTQIRARLRRMKAELGGLGLVIVDYLQTIQLSVSGNVTTARATGDVVLQLRNLASELDVPIVLLSQINRNYSQRQDKRPQLSDLRESGNIEEFADMVMFLYRHARQSAEAYEEAKNNGTENDVEIIVAKNRTGKTGITKLIFDDQYMRYVDPQSESIEAVSPGPPPPDQR
ncbi:MAG: toprim domain-containing protein [Firmicutes bacterium]|nr:toprim domain-containing protein [Bacillota bacterium]